jgi:hypothetical protein
LEAELVASKALEAARDEEAVAVEKDNTFLIVELGASREETAAARVEVGRIAALLAAAPPAAPPVLDQSAEIAELTGLLAKALKDTEGAYALLGHSNRQGQLRIDELTAAQLEIDRLKAALAAVPAAVPDRSDEVARLNGDIERLAGELAAVPEPVLDRSDEVARVTGLLEVSNEAVVRLEKEATAAFEKSHMDLLQIGVLGRDLETAKAATVAADERTRADAENSAAVVAARDQELAASKAETDALVARLRADVANGVKDLEESKEETQSYRTRLLGNVADLRENMAAAAAAAAEAVVAAAARHSSRESELTSEVERLNGGLFEAREGLRVAQELAAVPPDVDLLVAFNAREVVRLAAELDAATAEAALVASRAADPTTATAAADQAAVIARQVGELAAAKVEAAAATAASERLQEAMTYASQATAVAKTDKARADYQASAAKYETIQVRAELAAAREAAESNAASLVEASRAAAAAATDARVAQDGDYCRLQSTLHTAQIALEARTAELRAAESAAAAAPLPADYARMLSELDATKAALRGSDVRYETLTESNHQLREELRLSQLPAPDAAAAVALPGSDDPAVLHTIGHLQEVIVGLDGRVRKMSDSLFSTRLKNLTVPHLHAWKARLPKDNKEVGIMFAYNAEESRFNSSYAMTGNQHFTWVLALKRVAAQMGGSVDFSSIVKILMADNACTELKTFLASGVFSRLVTQPSSDLTDLCVELLGFKTNFSGLTLDALMSDPRLIFCVYLYCLDSDNEFLSADMIQDVGLYTERFRLHPTHFTGQSAVIKLITSSSLDINAIAEQVDTVMPFDDLCNGILSFLNGTIASAAT